MDACVYLEDAEDIQALEDGVRQLHVLCQRQRGVVPAWSGRVGEVGQDH